MDLAIPEINNSADAVRFGQFMTRDQYIFLWGARAALQKELKELKAYRRSQGANFTAGGPERSANGSREAGASVRETEYSLNGSATDYELQLSFKIQFYREALDAAPSIVLASLIGGDRCIPIIARSTFRHSVMPPTGV